MKRTKQNTGGDSFTLPLKASRSAVYETIYDAEGRLVMFVGMSDKAQQWAAQIIETINGQGSNYGISNRTT